LATHMTPREKTAKGHEQHVINLLKQKGQCNWCSSASQYANIDGFTVTASSGVIKAAFEIKSRNLSFPQVVVDYHYELMVDTAKVDALSKVSSVLKVPSYLATYFLADGVVIITPITDERGIVICKTRNQERNISAGMDKGNTIREVSHIKLDGSTIISTSEPKSSV